MARIAIIGGGNMGEALLAGLIKSGHPVRDLVVAEKSSGRSEYLARTYSVQVARLADAVENAVFVIVAVKPADIEAVIGEIAGAVASADVASAEKVLISVVAGVRTAFYESRLPAGSPVIRVMPNAPAVVGAGATALAAGRFATAAQMSEAAELFECVGAVLSVPESQIDAVTAVSGSGPAYVFLFVEALVDAGVASGLSRSVATELAVQTLAGSVAMLLERTEAAHALSSDRPDTSAAELRALVTSPGGTTAAGLRELEKFGLRAAVAAAVEAAKTRSEQLGITSE